jgi:hypothetical protein
LAYHDLCDAGRRSNPAKAKAFGLETCAAMVINRTLSLPVSESVKKRKKEPTSIAAAAASKRSILVIQRR